MPQYFKNDLCLVPIDKESLQNTLTELREAIVRAFALLKANSPAPDINDTKAFGSLYTGDNGRHKPIRSISYLGNWLSIGLSNHRNCGYGYSHCHSSQISRWQQSRN